MKVYGEDRILYFQIAISEVKIEIECKHRFVFSVCRDYLSTFEMPDIIVPYSPGELESRKRVINLKPSYAPMSITTDAEPVLENMIVLQKLAERITSYNMFLLHGAVVAKDNNAYIFTANSGIGKTTRAEIWLKVYPDSFIVNGDKPFIKISDSQAFACGTPWCGKEGWNTNTTVPIRAIFLLERADKHEDDSIEEIKLSKAFPALLEHVHRTNKPEIMQKTIQMLKALEGKVKVYRFRSHPTMESIRLAYETARPR